MATRTRPHPTRPQLDVLVPSDYVNGRQVTVADFIVEQITQGVDPLNAAGVAGVTPAEFQSWMREGVLVLNRVATGAVWETDFSPFQQDACLFADRVVRARSRHISVLSLIAETAARGGQQRRTVRSKTVGGNVVETVETVETMLPDLDMVKWKLERLEPGVYGNKATLNLTVTDLTDTEAVADMLQERMEKIAEALSVEYGATAIEASATES